MSTVSAPPLALDIYELKTTVGFTVIRVYTFFKPWARARPLQPAPMIKTLLPSSFVSEALPRASASISLQIVVMITESSSRLADGLSLSDATASRN